MKILIVDDEDISRKILEKKLEHLGICVSVNNAKEALVKFATAIQEEAPFDLITLDISMPGMDGAKVLENMRSHERGKGITRAEQSRIIMVTSRMNVSTIKECIRLGCSGYLTKPVSDHQLMETLTKAGLPIPDGLEFPTETDHARIVGQIIKRFYKGELQLPIFPDIVQEVEALVQSEDPSIDILEEIVEKDIIISSRLISIANSPLYKGVGQVDTLNAALVRLGIKAAHQVVTSVAAKSLFDAEEKQLNDQLHQLWMHSFATACLARTLGQKLNAENLDNLFLMGIIHDIGKVLLLKAYVDIAPEPDLESRELALAIHEIHTTFGATLLKKLRFSEAFVHVAQFHHWNVYARNDDRALVILNLANHLSHLMGYGFLGIQDRDADPEKAIENITAFKQLELDRDTVESVLKESRSVILQTAGCL